MKDARRRKKKRGRTSGKRTDLWVKKGKRETGIPGKYANEEGHRREKERSVREETDKKPGWRTL